MIKKYKTTFRIIAVILGLLSLAYIYLLSDFNYMFKTEKFLVVNEKLSNAKDDEQLKSVINLYNTIYKPIEKNCPCELATHYINNYSVFKPSFSKTIYSLKFHKQYGDDNCLKFLLLNSEFANGIVGIKEASKYYFNKSLNDLNEEQIITLLVMFENPKLYNPDRREKLIQEKVKLNLNLLNNKRGS